MGILPGSLSGPLYRGRQSQNVRLREGERLFCQYVQWYRRGRVDRRQWTYHRIPMSYNPGVASAAVAAATLFHLADRIELYVECSARALL